MLSKLLLYSKKPNLFLNNGGFEKRISIFAFSKILTEKKEKEMPKVKTKSGAKKRFKLTGSGKIKRKHAFKSHILTKKSVKRKRNLTQSGLVDKSDVGRIKDMLKI